MGEHEDTITHFDKLHTKLKTLKSPSSSDKSDYTQTLALLQQKVILKKATITQDIQKYEKEFYAKHHRLPTEQKDYCELCNRLKYLKKLLS